MPRTGKRSPKEFKKGLNLDQARRRRDALQRQARKDKREENRQKRRLEQSTEAITPKENFIKDENEGNVCDKAPKFDIKAVKQYLEKAAEIKKRHEPTPQGVLVFGSGDCVSKIIFIYFV